MKKFGFVAALALAAGVATAQDAPTGDAANGETLFGRQCVSCHSAINAEGEVVAGRGAKTGPNLFGLLGQVIGSVEGFRYGESLLAVAATEATWDETAFVAYVQDPTGWLRTTLGDARARSKMAFKVRAPEDAADIWAYLAAFSDEEDSE
jgi:cytochrome c